MELACGNRDDARLPPLSLGLSSVRLIVNKIEAEYARAAASSDREIVRYDPNIDEGYDDYYEPPLSTPRDRVFWSRLLVNLGVALSKCVPSVSFGNFAALAVSAGFLAPRMISYLLLYPFCRLVFGTLYPAYASYKAVRTKNLKEYVKWMMYWIVFALFTCTETFTDVFLSWFPFYYEVKIVLVLWLLSPATKGSSILYRKFVHPALCRREQEIDEYIAKAKDQGYHTVLNLGTKGVNYATTVIMQTAIKGGGGLVQQLKKSYSLSDLSECEPRSDRSADEADDVLTEPRTIRRAVAKSGYSTRRSASESNSRGMYFPEVDVDVRGARHEPDFSHIKSNEDISSGYSSADNSASLTRTASLSAASRSKVRSRTTVTTIKRPQAAEDEVIIEELQDDDSFEFANMPPLLNIPPNLYISNSDPPFIYQLVGDQVRIIQVLSSNTVDHSNCNIENNNSDRWDQNETYEDASPTIGEKTIDNKDLDTVETITNTTKEETNNKEVLQEKNKNESIKTVESLTDVNRTITPKVNVTVDEVEISTEQIEDPEPENVLHQENPKETLGIEKSTTVDVNLSENKQSQNTAKDNLTDFDKKVELKIEDLIETTSFDTSSLNDNDSEDSDDEASFGTPEGSPKNKRKSPAGKYGKRKAPPPPVAHEKPDYNDMSQTDNIASVACKNSSDTLTEMVKKLPENSFKGTGTHSSLQVINPIAEKKRRNKSKSPGRIPKTGGSGIGKLLQLPGKLAFWSKSDDKNKDNISTSSGDHSRRSSTVEKAADDFQSCSALHELSLTSNKEIAEDQLSYKDAEFTETEVISHDIIEKSDELQKLIDAKIESHPEYKFVPLHEVPTTSKTTDV